MREAYRRNKTTLYNVIPEEGAQFAVALVYIGKSLTTFNELEPKIQLALSALATRITTQTEQ